MRQKLLSEAAAFLVKNRRRRMWTKVVSCMAAVVVFCTTYVLILPALTLEKDTECGYEEHVHTEACYLKGDKDVSDGSNTQVVSSGDVSAGDEGTYCGKHAHKHTTACFGDSDTTADVETEEDWKASFADVTLTGNWAQDVVAIAQSQVGYKESEDNFFYDAEEKKLNGYTRYGAWYGDEYGDWNAMFVAFCLDYAQVTDYPVDVDCAEWVELLSQEEYDLYRPASEYTPVAGDLIFLDSAKGDGIANYVGIVAEVTTSDAGATQLTVIEGDSEDQVKQVSYKGNDASILGYGKLPYQLTVAEQEEVDYVIELIDEMPSADEIDAKIAEFEDAEDYEGEEAWLTEVYQQVAEAYYYYSELSDKQKVKVTNADKLLELEYIWSVTPYIVSGSNRKSAKPTTVKAATTSEFIELNLYDYYGDASASENGKTSVNYYWDLYSGNKTENSTLKEYPAFQWNGGAYKKTTGTHSNGTAYTDRNVVDNIDFGNSMITDYDYIAPTTTYGKSSSARTPATTSSANGAINRLDYGTYGVNNRPIGLSTGSDVISRTLVNGYPELAEPSDVSVPSLKYLFTESNFAKKQNTNSIDGLFQQDTTSGAYYYDSRKNHAQYDSITEQFTLYNQIITPNFILYPFGNFLPFNDITDRNKATQVSTIEYMGGTNGYVQSIISRLSENSNATKKQLSIMLEAYRDNVKLWDGTNAWNNWSAVDALNDFFNDKAEPNTDKLDFGNDTELVQLLQKLYNIDYDVEKNFFFGMEMKMNFMQPKDGLTGNDNDNDGTPDYDMIFYFTGDDDVWVFIDNILFLDLSGIHRHVGGKIDFVKGEISYYYLNVADGGDVYDGTVGDKASTLYATYSFKDMLLAGGIKEADLGKYLKKDAAGNYTTFLDYSSHSFNFYYMERGSGSSVCRMNFNFPLLRQHSISVSKELSTDKATSEILGNPDFKFQILKENGTDLFIAKGVTYDILDAAGTKIGTGTTGDNGIFTLKAGQTAEFHDIKENAGKYFVRELLDATVVPQYGEVIVNGESATIVGDVIVGSSTFSGIHSPIMDASSGSAVFKFNNEITVDKLGSLEISKVLQAYSARVASQFKIYVELDGVPLAVGTKYTVGNETRSVNETGYIVIGSDETAKISNILAGTKFYVKEDVASAEGYIVQYSGTGVTTDGTGASGVVTTQTAVKVIVNNTENGATVTISSEKAICNPDGNEHSYNFQLVQVTDQTGSKVLEGGITLSSEATVKEKGSFSFTLTYVEKEIEGLPATYYYKITEENDTTGASVIDSSVYVVEVCVSKGTGGVLQATVENIWKDGNTYEVNNQVSFTNTLVGGLRIEKDLLDSEGTNATPFTFEIELKQGEKLLSGTYKAVLTKQDATKETKDITFTDGKAIVTLKDSESLEISQIPYGVTWKITENASGYIIIHEINGEASNGNTASGNIVAGGQSAVKFINEVSYKLPETGGSGTRWYALAGIAFIFGAAYLLYRRKKYAWVSH